MASLDQIQKKIKELEAQAQAILSVKSQTALNKIRDLMSAHGLSTADIEAYVGGKRGPKRGAAVVARTPAGVGAMYADPATGATWSGRGRAPGWIADAKDRSKYLISGSASTGTSKALKASKAPKAGNYPRGPQPAKYADPKTGATWSGRGRAPAWIAHVKDRTAFLIASAKPTAASAEAPVKSRSKAVAKKKAASKPAATRKVAVRKSAAAEKKPGRRAARAAAGGKTARQAGPSRKSPVRTTAAGANPAPSPSAGATSETAV